MNFLRIVKSIAVCEDRDAVSMTHVKALKETAPASESGRYRDAKTSKALREARSFEGMGDILAGLFAAKARRWENFRWV